MQRIDASPELLGRVHTANDYRFAVDAPVHWRLPAAEIDIVGWCLHTSGGPPAAVRVTWDSGEMVGKCDQPRTDVAGAYSLPEGRERCGFVLRVNLLPGRKRLSLQARDDTGRWVDLASVVAKVPRSPGRREAGVVRLAARYDSNAEKPVNQWPYSIGGLLTPDGYHIVVDSPSSWNLSDYRTHISGWCIPPPGVKLTGIRLLWEGGGVYGRYGEPRPDVSHAFSLPKDLETCGFKISVALPSGTTLLHLEACDGDGQWHELVAWTAKVPRTAFLRFWSRNRPAGNPAESYEAWIYRYEKPNWWQRREIVHKARSLEYSPLFSVLLPTYNTDEKWLVAAIESVRRQVYPHWELCVSDDASSKPGVRKVLQHYGERDARVKVVYRKVNGHISASSNSALALAAGEFVALLDHDDELSPYALYAVALELNRSRDLDVIYSDEDKIDEHGWRFDPYFKSDWNPDLVTAQNCISHLGVYRTARLREIGGFREGVEGCQDWDVVLRMTEGVPTSRVRHIPRVLYHWRAIPGSTALALDEKSYIGRAGRKMLTDHFEKTNQEVAIAPVEGGHWGARYCTAAQPLVTIIIPTRNQARLLRRCIASVRAKTGYPAYEFLIVDNKSTERSALSYLNTLRAGGVQVLAYEKPFNYSAINNFAVSRAAGELLCFLNNDMEVITGEWLEEMVSHALRPEIGAVGAKLLFPDNTLQHTGIVLGLGGPAGHILYKFNSNTGGYYNRARLVCNYTAVTAACMVIRKEVFLEAGGFDAENLPVSYNDVDLCIRIQNLGYRNLYTPFAQLYHHESASRGQDSTSENRQRALAEINYMWDRWGELLLHDPNYNPNLSLKREDYSFAAPPRVLPIWRESLQPNATELDSEAEIPADWIKPKKNAPYQVSGRVTTSAAEVVSAVYRQVLNRAVDADGLVVYTAALRSGKTVQTLVVELASSIEFRESAIGAGTAPEEGLTRCYERLLARAPDETGLIDQAATVARHGWDLVIAGFVYSPEYQERFGSYTVPYPAGAPESRLTWAAEPADRDYPEASTVLAEAEAV